MKKTNIWTCYMLGLSLNRLGEGFRQKNIKWLDLSHAHLTPASQAERWMKRRKKFKIYIRIHLAALLHPNISIMYSNCILETGKCWQAHNSPIGWHFVFTNYPPIGEYRRVGLVWPAFNSTKTCQGYLYREGGRGQVNKYFLYNLQFFLQFL